MNDDNGKDMRYHNELYIFHHEFGHIESDYKGVSIDNEQYNEIKKKRTDYCSK